MFESASGSGYGSDRPAALDGSLGMATRYPADNSTAELRITTVIVG